MKFGQFCIDDAEGFMLAHPLRQPKGTFSKGHVLKDSDLAREKISPSGCWDNPSRLKRYKVV